MPKLLGVVLTGGRSVRMGRDKWRLPDPFQPGQNFLSRSLSVLSPLTEHCLVSCAANAPIPGYDCILDDAEGAGPMAGIIAGLSHARANGHDAIFALACDLPLLTTRVLHPLVKAYGERPESLLAVFENTENGKLEMLAAIYSTESLTLFRKAMATGKHALKSVIPEEARLLLPCSGKDARCFLNCNTPEELERLRAARD